MVKRRCFVFRALHSSRCNAPLARRPLLRERARSAIISSRAARGRLLGLAVTSGTTSSSPLLLHITPRNARFKRLSGGFLYHIGAVAVAAPGHPGHKKRRRSRRRRFLLMIVDNSRAYPASNVTVSRVNTGFSRGFPSRLGLSRLSQIRCLLTVKKMVPARAKTIPFYCAAFHFPNHFWIAHCKKITIPTKNSVFDGSDCGVPQFFPH